jgi:hypothetical protein
MFEIKVKVQDEETTLTEKFLHYDEDITLSHEDPLLCGMVKQVIHKFKGSGHYDVSIVIRAEW